MCLICYYYYALILVMYLQVAYRFAPDTEPNTFGIDGTTGVITLLQALNFEDISSYEFYVEAYDFGDIRLTSNVSVT